MFSPEILQKRREQLGLSKTDIARQIGITKQSYFTWENGKTVPSKPNIEKLAQVLRVSTTYFESEHKIVHTYLKLNALNREKVEDYAEELLIVQEENKVVQLYSVKVIDDIELSAGTGESFFDEYETREVFADKEYSYDIATWIKGDSMEPKYLSGEVALIHESGFDYDGAVYAVVWNERAYIKKVYLEEDGYRLVSLNPKYPDMFASAEDSPKIVGKVIGSFMPMEV
ncbi:XRE family transcriptional regulator [Streptococcus dysgalactiae]|uniref:XRE family transcriptional regulator n=1 Tax=Streptococcus dysgalactiae TaxID=1334 RepID=UPI00186936E9|nr:XRE family transcriptional regulator [Streptococcus dysgalactiae]